MNNLSNRAFFWLMGGLITAIVVLAMVIQHAQDIAAVFVWVERGIIAAAVVAVLWLFYLLYHHFQVRRLDRMRMLAEVGAVETGQWQVEQEFNHRQMIELKQMAIEEQRIMLEREKLHAEMELNRWRVLVPAGHTVVFPEEDYHSIASHSVPRIAGPSKGDTVDSEPRKIQVPGAYDLVDIFKNMDIAKDHIFLAKTEDGNITVNAHSDLCHGVFNAATGQGKTVIERGIEMQLLKAGHEVIHADIKFTLIDEKGLDYRPMAKALLSQGNIAGIELPHLLMAPDQIKIMLEWAALTEVPRRLEMYHAGIHNYQTLYVFLEEFLYLVKLYPEIAEWVETLIIVGRSLGIKLFTVAQNFLARDTKLSGAMRENFQTAYYIGGDDHSGAVILDMGKRELMQFLTANNVVLGQGLAMMRNNTVAPQARLVRTGWASNEAIYYLLGCADNFRLPGTPSGLYGGIDLKQDDVQNRMSPGSNVTVLDASSNQQRSLRNTGPLENPLSEDVDLLGAGPDGSPDLILGDDDLMMDDIQIQQFEILYKALGNIKECLRRINGCNHRHHRHGSWIVRSKGLRRQ